MLRRPGEGVETQHLRRARPGDSPGAEHRFAGVLLIAIVALPIGQRPGVDTAPGKVGSAREGNVPNLIGMNAKEAEDELENAGLYPVLERLPREYRRCKVVAQDPAGGGEAEEHDDVKVRCEVRVPRLRRRGRAPRGACNR